MSVVAKRRWRTVLIVRRLLMCAIGIIALMALLSVHVQQVTIWPADASFKLPTVCSRSPFSYFFILIFCFWSFLVSDRLSEYIC